MKPDLAHRLTGKELSALEKRIAAEYKKAAEELADKVNAYFEHFKKQDEETKAQIGAVVNGREYTEQDYQQWRLAQIGRGKRFEALRDLVAERMTQANTAAAAYINDTAPGLYSLNRNYAAYTIEQQAGRSVGFDLWDEQTVKRLIVEQPDLMPYYPRKRAVNSGIDLAWGKRQITAQVTGGILQGESMDDLASRLQRNIPEMNRNSAIRAARTAVTGAQNGGRQDSYDAAVKMGIELEKRWLAALDGRTRHDHAAADGQTVAEDEPFTVGGEKLMYPGDASGSPWNIYNCRCTMIAQVKGVDMSDAKRRARDPVTGESEVIENMTYQEWEHSKKSLTHVYKSDKIKYSDNDIEIGRSLGAAAFRDNVKLPNGKIVKVTEGSKITKVFTFAGKGAKKPLWVAEALAEQYGVDAERWTHKRGDGYVDVDGKSKHAELHWFEHPDIGRIKMKVKRYFEDES